MRSHLLILFFFLSSFVVSAQQSTVNINWGKQEILLNGKKQNKDTGIEELQEAIGKPSRILIGDTLSIKFYIYDSLGLSFAIDTNYNLLTNLFINMSKGRGSHYETTPAKLFSGNLIIENYPITSTETIEKIKQQTKLPFEDWFTGAYFYTATNEDFSITITYTNKKKEAISQCIISWEEKKDE